MVYGAVVCDNMYMYVHVLYVPIIYFIYVGFVTTCLQTKLNSGGVGKLHCPTPDCSAAVSLLVLRAVLNDDLFERYVRTYVHTHILYTRMQNIVYTYMHMYICVVCVYTYMYSHIKYIHACMHSQGCMFMYTYVRIL